MDREDRYYVDIGKLGYSEENESLRIVEKQYATPNKLYNIDKDTAYWPEDAEDYIYWHSEADKWAEDYAKSYKVKMSPKDFLDLTTTNGADSLKTGDSLGLGKLRDLDIDEFNKELYQNIFLQIAFKDYHYLAQVVGHEGRHRMFALMQAGVKSVDVELICDVWGTEYNKYKPFELEYIDLVGQFNKSVKVRVYNPIPMSWKQHKAIRPNLKDESLIVEYLDEVGSSNDFPVYITDDVYKLKSILQKEDKAYRIFNDRETYYFQDAHGDKTHYDMLKYALDNGYVPLDSPIVFNDSLGKHIDVGDSEEEGYMVFIPRDYDEDIRYYTSLGEDSYYSCKIYSFGIIYVRDTYAYKNGLFKALGDADRTIYYDGYDELTIVDRHGNEKTIEIEDDPNNHLFDDIDESLQESKSAEDLLNDLDKEFGQEEVYMWSTYILPNGHFLNPDNSDALEDSDKAYEHCDFEDWAWSKGYNLSDIYNNCIKMNVTVPYISMPDKAKPTQEQFKAVKKIIDNVDYLDSIDSSYIRDILPPEQAERVFKDAVGKLVLFYTPVGHEVFDLGVSSADDIIKAINKAYVRGGFNEELSRDEIENRVANELGTSKEPIEGPSYILRDGSFLKIWNSNKDIKGMSGSKSVSGKAMHLDVDGYINKEVDSDAYSYYYLNVDCIRVNTGFEEYIVLSKERPNNAQFDSLLKWLNFYFFDKEHNKLKVMDWYGSYLNTKEYYLDETMPEEIIKKIKSYYVTGELRESINNNLEDRVVRILKDNYKSDSIDRSAMSYLILRDGTLIKCNHHPNLIDTLCDSGEFSEEEMKLFDSKGAEYFTEALNCIRATVDEYENYISLPKERLTEKQYAWLVKLLDVDSSMYDEIHVTSDGSNFFDSSVYQTYSFKENTVDEVIKKIKRYYATGELLESRSKYRIEWTTPEDSFEKSFSDYQKALDYYTDIRDGDIFWSTIEMYDTSKTPAELLAIDYKSNADIDRYLNNENLQEKIVKKGSKWQVQSENGKNLGTYDTKSEAEKRLQQVHYFKHMNENASNIYKRYSIIDNNGKNLGGLFNGVWSIIYKDYDSNILQDTAEALESQIDYLMEEHKQPEKMFDDDVHFAFSNDFIEEHKHSFENIKCYLERLHCKLNVEDIDRNNVDVVYEDENQIAYKLEESFKHMNEESDIDNITEELYNKDSMKKENNTLQEKKDKEVVVDGVNITNIVNDLFENHKWMMDKLGE